MRHVNRKRSSSFRFTRRVAVSPALVQMLQVHNSRFPLLTRQGVHVKGLHRIVCVKMLCAAHRQTRVLLPVAAFIFNASDLMHSCIQ